MSINTSALSKCLTEPHAWQTRLSADQEPKNRLIRIPTGFGKTAGTVLAWIHHRVERDDDRWPRRLVFCLPMRTLVEQTESEIRGWLKQLGLIEKVAVQVLMGGVESGEWATQPKRFTILIGTQDMLFSRALNRGFASSRGRWPMEFGLLNHDCLWVMDEVQLMDTALATSAQLQQFREDDRNKALRPTYTWWMSATLRPDWLKSVDTQELITDIESTMTTIPDHARTGGFWDIHKPVIVQKIKDVSAWAALVLEKHRESAPGEYGRITLVIANTVKVARELHAELTKRISPKLKKGETTKSIPELCLIHSRFRPNERRQWREAFLSRSACTPESDRIIVATQVVEAGVDISATTLVTELAPWSSLIQRFGRAGRYLNTGGASQPVTKVTVIDRELKDDKAAAPYAKSQLDAAALALNRLSDVGIASLESLEDIERAKPDEGLLSSLYPYTPKHLLLRRELDELFDTTPDLTGADLDISRFIRSGDERDIFVFWRDLPTKETPADDLEPRRDELCPVSFLDARKWLFDGANKVNGVWIWDYLDGTWRTCAKEDVYPGRTILVDRIAGGYSAEAGFTGNKNDIPPYVATRASGSSDADKAQSREDLSEAPWKTILTHGREAQAEVTELATALALPASTRRILALAALWHDYGKAHPAFVACIRRDATGHPGRLDLAKAPHSAWRKTAELYRISTTEHRAGFRHELASMLGIFTLVATRHPRHPAVLGELLPLLSALGHIAPTSDDTAAATPAERELLELDAASLNLLLHLVCAHHGKIRVGLHAAPDDQDYVGSPGIPADTSPLRGVCAGDMLPAISFTDSKGTPCTLPVVTLTHDLATMGISLSAGLSWTDRMSDLLARYGPFTLAYLEALIRTADIRASRLTSSDALLG